MNAWLPWRFFAVVGISRVSDTSPTFVVMRYILTRLWIAEAFDEALCSFAEVVSVNCMPA